MPVKKLREYLDKQGVKYVSISHSPAYTMSEIAATAHVPGNEVAKTVMVKLEGRMVMTVLPSAYRVDLELLRDLTGASSVELATEEDFKELFPECDVGAMPPFGPLYGFEVYVALELERWKNMAFNAGSHTELMQLAYRDFQRLVKPKPLDFAVLTRQRSHPTAEPEIGGEGGSS